MKPDVLFAEFMRTPWALEPGYLATMAAVLGRWRVGIPAPEDHLAEVRANRVADGRRREETGRAAGGAIAVIPVLGIISQRANLVQEYSGGVACTQLAARIREAVADDSVGQVLLDIHSPGGSVYGIQELGAEIRALQAEKPIVAVANSLCASAAYWLASQCTEVYCTPGGEVGSIGVFQAHTDESKALDTAGLKVTLIASGKYKTEGNPYGPLPPEAEAFMQSRTNDYYRAFSGAVARGRVVPLSTVRDAMGQGRLLGADAALREKMIDGIATVDAVIAGMKKNIARGQRGAATSRGGAGASVSDAARLAHAARTREIEILELEGRL